LKILENLYGGDAGQLIDLTDRHDA